MADWSLCLRGLRGTYTSLIRLQHTLARQSLSWLLPRLFPIVQVHLREPHVSQTFNLISKFLLAWSNLIHILDRIVHKFLDRLQQALIDFFKFLDLRIKMVHSSLKLCVPAAFIDVYVGVYFSQSWQIEHSWSQFWHLSFSSNGWI